MAFTPASSVGGGGGGGGVVQQGARDGTVQAWYVDNAPADLLDVALASALPAGPNNIGDVDVLTLPALAQLPAALVGGRLDVSLGAAPATVAVAEPVSVDDNGASLTVDSAQLPAALVGGRLDENLGAWLGSTAPTVGQKAMAASVPVALASDQAVIPVHGAVAADAAIDANPLTVGGRSNAALPAAVTADNEAVHLWLDRRGRANVADIAAPMTWVSAKNAAPAIGAVQADTGALGAGDWDFEIFLACSDTVAVGKGLVVEHRNAANGATLHNLGGATPNGGAMYLRLRRYTLAANERIRVIAGTAAGAASSMYVSAIGRLQVA